MIPGELCSGGREALVIQGANTTCGRLPPLAFGISTAVSVVAAAFALGVFARVPRPRRARFLLPLALLSLPGLVAVFVWRGDAPMRLTATASGIERLESSVREHARAHGCARLTQNDCEACQPILRLALADLGECESSARVEVGARALEDGQSCTASGEVLRCGMP